MRTQLMRMSMCGCGFNLDFSFPGARLRDIHAPSKSGPSLQASTKGTSARLMAGT
jgi:hypothetical protein